MNLLQQTYEIQENLGLYCKTGIDQNLPGITENRLHHYRRLVFNVVKNTLEQAYPIALQVLGEKQFRELIHDFFSNHDCRSPQIWKLPGEFYEYSLENKTAEKINSPWLNDLLLFEWTEIEVHTMPDAEIPKAGDITSYLDDVLLINPEYRLIQMEYPAHLVKADKLEDNKGKYFVLISRDPKEGKVMFFNLSILHTWVFERIANQKISVRSLFSDINSIFGIDSETILAENLESFLKDLHLKQVVLGSSI